MILNYEHLTLDQQTAIILDAPYVGLEDFEVAHGQYVLDDDGDGFTILGLGVH